MTRPARKSRLSHCSFGRHNLHLPCISSQTFLCLNYVWVVSLAVIKPHKFCFQACIPTSRNGFQVHLLTLRSYKSQTTNPRGESSSTGIRPNKLRIASAYEAEYLLCSLYMLLLAGHHWTCIHSDLSSLLHTVSLKAEFPIAAVCQWNSFHGNGRNYLFYNVMQLREYTGYKYWNMQP